MEADGQECDHRSCRVLMNVTRNVSILTKAIYSERFLVSYNAKLGTPLATLKLEELKCLYEPSFAIA